MSCQTCGDTGFWPFVDIANTKSDELITTDDLLFAICLCPTGLQMRRTENAGRKCTPLWEVWCAREQVDPGRVWRLEDALTPEDVQQCGFSTPVPQIAREAALLNASKRRPRL